MLFPDGDQPLSCRIVPPICSAFVRIVAGEGGEKPIPVRNYYSFYPGGRAPSILTGTTASLIARAVANPGLMTVLMRCSRSSKPANALFIAFTVSHSTSGQP